MKADEVPAACLKSAHPTKSSHLRQPARPDRLDEDVPLGLLQNDDVACLTDLHFVADEDDFGAVVAHRT